MTEVEELIADLINSLPVLSEIDPDDAAAIEEAKAQIAAAKDQITEAVTSYNALADTGRDACLEREAPLQADRLSGGGRSRAG